MDIITPFNIYVIMQLGMITGMFIMFGTIAIIVGFILTIMESEVNGWERKAAVKFIISVIVACFCFAAAFLLPSTKTAILMYGIPASISVAKSLELDESAKLALQSVNRLMKEYIESEKK